MGAGHGWGGIDYSSDSKQHGQNEVGGQVGSTGRGVEFVCLLGMYLLLGIYSTSMDPVTLTMTHTFLSKGRALYPMVD